MPEEDDRLGLVLDVVRLGKGSVGQELPEPRLDLSVLGRDGHEANVPDGVSQRRRAVCQYCDAVAT
jgi:hypothetical protein